MIAPGSDGPDGSDDEGVDAGAAGGATAGLRAGTGGGLPARGNALPLDGFGGSATGVAAGKPGSMGFTRGVCGSGGDEGWGSAARDTGDDASRAVVGTTAALGSAAFCGRPGDTFSGAALGRRGPCDVNA